MTVVAWDEKYSVGVEEIDEQHKGLVTVLDNLFKIVRRSHEKEEIEEIFNALDEYVDIHFTTEEKYMERFAFGGLEEHKKEHEKFKRNLSILRKQLFLSPEMVNDNLLEFLWDWFKDHLCDVDQKYVECFSENGLK